MDINISFFGQREWKVLPDPSTLKRGESVTWIVQARRMDNRRLRWTVYFEGRTPFSPFPYLLVRDPGEIGLMQIRFQYRTTSLYTGLGKLAEGFNLQPSLRDHLGDREPADHEGAIGPIVAEIPGEYKYGIKVEDAETGESPSE